MAFADIKPTTSPILKVDLYDPEKEEESGIAIEGFGPETLTGAVRDLLNGHYEGKKVRKIEIDFPDDFTD